MRASQTLRVGVYPDMASADGAVKALLDAGFPRESLSVVCPQCEAGDLGGTEQVPPAGSETLVAAGSGGAIGAVLGGLTAAMGVAATGGTGLFVVGPLLGGAAAGGVVGSFVGAMGSRGVEPEIADYYDQALAKGSVLVAVESSSGSGGPTLEEAERVLLEAGAEPIELPKG